MRGSRPTLASRALCCSILGTVVLLSGCGGSDSAASGPRTEAEARYESIKKVGGSYTKEAIAEAREKAVQEGKARPLKK